MGEDPIAPSFRALHGYLCETEEGKRLFAQDGATRRQIELEEKQLEEALKLMCTLAGGPSLLLVIGPLRNLARQWVESRALLPTPPRKSCVVDGCCYGSPWRRRLRWACNINLSELPRGRCFHGGHAKWPHLPLSTCGMLP